MLHNLDADPYKSRADLDDAQVFVLERNADMRSKFLADQLDDFGIPADAKVKVFTKLEFFLCGMDGVPLDPIVPGHTDIVYYYPDYRFAVIFDSKFGRIPVSHAAVNDQLRSYAVMFAEHFFVDKIVVAITQPWLKGSESIHAAVYTSDNLPAFKKDLIEVIEAGKLSNALRVASPEACRWCRARAVCPEAIACVKAISDVSVNSLSPSQLENLHATVNVAEGVIEAWRGELKRILENGGTLEKFELSKAQETRAINDFDAAKEMICDSAKLISEEDFKKAAKVSVSQIETLYRDSTKPKKITKEVAKARVESALGDLIIRKPKSRSLKLKSEAEE